MTGSAAKRSGRCVMLELKERGVPGGEGTATLPDGRPADDGKRSEAEWTLYDAGIEERGVPGGEGTRIIPDRRVADWLKMVPKMDLHFT